MQRFVVAALLGLASSNNIVSPATRMCLDIKAMCAECSDGAPLDDESEGCDRAGCDREDPADMKRGAGLQMWECHDEENQNFEVIGGRIKNKAAGREAEHAELCIDIKALCEDGSDTPGCKRQSVDDITEEAEIQLWTCRSDDATGRNSSSYGNQLWDLLGNGYFRNERTGLCLVAHQGDESGTTTTSGAAVHVHTCPEEAADTDNEFVFDFETGDMASETNAAGSERLFSVVSEVTPAAAPKAEEDSLGPWLAGACALGIVGAVVALARREQRAEQRLPLTASDASE